MFQSSPYRSAALGSALFIGGCFSDPLTNSELNPPERQSASSATSITTDAADIMEQLLDLMKFDIFELQEISISTRRTSIVASIDQPEVGKVSISFPSRSDQIPIIGKYETLEFPSSNGTQSTRHLKFSVELPLGDLDLTLIQTPELRSQESVGLKAKFSPNLLAWTFGVGSFNPETVLPLPYSNGPIVQVRPVDREFLEFLAEHDCEIIDDWRPVITTLLQSDRKPATDGKSMIPGSIKIKFAWGNRNSNISVPSHESSSADKFEFHPDLSKLVFAACSIDGQVNRFLVVGTDSRYVYIENFTRVSKKQPRLVLGELISSNPPIERIPRQEFRQYLVNADIEPGVNQRIAGRSIIVNPKCLPLNAVSTENLRNASAHLLEFEHEYLLPHNSLVLVVTPPEEVSIHNYLYQSTIEGATAAIFSSPTILSDGLDPIVIKEYCYFNAAIFLCDTLDITIEPKDLSDLGIDAEKFRINWNTLMRRITGRSTNYFSTLSTTNQWKTIIPVNLITYYQSDLVLSVANEITPTFVNELARLLDQTAEKLGAKLGSDTLAVSAMSIRAKTISAVTVAEITGR